MAYGPRDKTSAYDSSVEEWACFRPFRGLGWAMVRSPEPERERDGEEVSVGEVVVDEEGRSEELDVGP